MSGFRKRKRLYACLTCHARLTGTRRAWKHLPNGTDTLIPAVALAGEDLVRPKVKVYAEQYRYLTWFKGYGYKGLNCFCDYQCAHKWLEANAKAELEPWP